MHHWAAAALGRRGSGREIAVRVVAPRESRKLNRQWRGKDKPTNVLSFPLAETSDFTSANIAGTELLLGDIILAHGVCETEAADKRISVEDHAAHLPVHGTLHLLGYDHHNDDQAADMEAREVRALRRLGIANPYEDAA